MNKYIILQTNYWMNSKGSTSLLVNRYFDSPEEAMECLHDRKKEDSDYRATMKQVGWKDNKLAVDYDGALVIYNIIELNK